MVLTSPRSPTAQDVADLADFRVHRGSDLFGDQPARIPGEIAEQRCGKQREQKQIGQRQPECRGADQFTECRHGSSHLSLEMAGSGSISAS
jgi:hypothetical protein